MKGFLLIAFTLLVGTAWGQPVPTSAPHKPIGAEAEVRALHERFENGWNQHDAAGIAAIFSENSDYTEPDGRTAFGRTEIEKLFRIEHASVFKQSELHLAVERVRFVGEDVALVDGSYELFRARDPKGNEIGTRAGFFTSLASKEGGKWTVNASRLMLRAQLLWRDSGK